MELAVLGLILCDWVSRAVEDDESRTRSALVNGTNEAIFQVIVAAILRLDQGTPAINGLAGMDLNWRRLVCLNLRVDIRHVKRVLDVKRVRGHDGGGIGPRGIDGGASRGRSGRRLRPRFSNYSRAARRADGLSYEAPGCGGQEKDGRDDEIRK